MFHGLGMVRKHVVVTGVKLQHVRMRGVRLLRPYRNGPAVPLDTERHTVYGEQHGTAPLRNKIRNIDGAQWGRIPIRTSTEQSTARLGVLRRSVLF